MNQTGLYEKAMPIDMKLTDKLNLAKKHGFDYLQLSLDESPQRLERLDWSRNQKKELVDYMFDHQIRIGSLCCSANRKWPIGHPDQSVRETGIQVIKKAVDLAVDLGARNILTSGYDVYQQTKTPLSRENYIESLKECVNYAASKQVVLSIEVMDDEFAGSVTKILQIERSIQSPFLQVFPDLGNLTAWVGNQAGDELESGFKNITEIHFKDGRLVDPNSKLDSFRNVPYGEGDVDFDGLMKVLGRLNYTGPFVIEMWAHDAGYENEIAVAKHFLDGYLQKYHFDK
ncbi:L-ribulose-5-phosphate 3-epimerase [Lacticaseibacillus hegangensis]|uniref:L-ribulose-5-phosphate 3-epimerase n=1 Tax=Lacticaseibacillus hegangensis TaxID=2486010 RepID=A0ABW4CYX4_9LACO|nr:L-ribulose-5-phosphate 3-epimerase [Lacticaseibacillus hegangensis]